MLTYKEAQSLTKTFVKVAMDANTDINEWNLVGLVVEHLGQRIIANKFSSVEYHISSPRQVGKLITVIPKDERNAWGISFPDGIVIKDLGEGVYQVTALVEYKSENILHMEKLQVQFNGFLNFLDLLRNHNMNRARIIVAVLLGKEVKAIKTVEVAENPEIIYIVPYGRNAEYIPDTLTGKEQFKQIRLPISIYAIIRLIRQTRARKNST